MKYTITYQETYGGVFEIEADSEQEATEIFQNDFDYYSRKFDCWGTDIAVTRDEPETIKYWSPSDDKPQKEIDPRDFDLDNFF